MEATKLDSTPIKEISMQTPPGFMVRAWVLRKVQSTEDKRTTLYLEDETGKIRAVGFGEEVAARCKTVEELTVYEVSGVHVFVDKESKHFPAVSEFSLKLNEEMTIKPLMNVPRRYNFVDIASLPNERDLRDVLGVITKVFDAYKDRRDIALMDRSNAVVALTLWHEMVDFPVEVGSVLAVQLAYINDFYDVNLGTCEWTYLEVLYAPPPEAGKAEELLECSKRPEVGKAKELFEWYQSRDHDRAPPTEISRSFEQRTGKPLWP